MISEGYCGASPAEAHEFASGAFFEFLELAVALHFRAGPERVERCAEEIAYRTVKPAAGHYIAVGEYGEVAVAAVAAVVDSVGITVGWYAEEPFFIEEESPQVILEVERSAGVLVLLELAPHRAEKVAILIRRYAGRLLIGGGAVSTESKYADPFLYYEVNDLRYLSYIGAGYGGHHGYSQVSAAQCVDCIQGGVEGAGSAYGVVCVAHTVDRQLIFHASVVFKASAHLIGDVKGIAEYGEWNIAILE